jgi:ABC-type glutathione transport system ATPase component
MSAPALALEGLCVRYPGQARPALDGLSLTLRAGCVLGVIGESGSGKSTLAAALTGLLPEGSRVDGTIRFDGGAVAATDAAAWRRLRGRVVGYAPQDALASLHPLRTIGDQLEEVLALHRGLRGRACRAAAAALAARCGLDDARLLVRHPHALSGGQRQRAGIVLALAGQPRVLVADEITSALDPLRAAAIVRLLAGLAREDGLAVVFIAHDLGQVARLADDVLVLRGGVVQEYGPRTQVYAAPESDYTRSLLALRPGIADDSATAAVMPVGAVRATARGISPTQPALVVDALSVHHGARLTLDQVSLTIAAGEVLGLVGASGSGKSTLARSLLVLDGRPDGRIMLDGASVDGAHGAALRALRRRIGFVFQDPAASLDPRWSVAELVTEPLRLGGERDRAALAAAAQRLLTRVALDDALLGRLPHQLSGGQQQRVAIARALAARPLLLVCDEAVSALDVSVQAGILDLIAGLARDEGLACLFISHDLEAVRRIADRVAVMEDGRIVECAATAQLYAAPAHAHTRALLQAVYAPE